MVRGDLATGVPLNRLEGSTTRIGAGRRTVARSLVTIGIAFVAAACTGVAERSSAPMSSTPAPTASATPAVTPTVEPPTTRRIAGRVLGGGTFPAYSVEAPDGWSSADGQFVIKQRAAVIGLSVWDVVEVPSDPCHWQGHLTSPGPTVDDLVQALLAQATRAATRPADVTLAGHAGKYIEWSVPADMVVTGDADFEGCDVEPSNGHLDFISWLSSSGGSRYQQVAGQVDRLWILDVDGQRLVVDATYSRDTTEVDRAELGQVAESLRFEDS
jgi:hypothetical protein